MFWQFISRGEASSTLELCEVRQALEPAAAELAALRATAREVETIQKWYAQMEKAARRTKKFIGADLQFHANNSG